MLCRNYIILHYIILLSFHTPFTPTVTRCVSTKLCMTSSASECKQMSFQSLLERTSIRDLLETKRKIVPRFGSGVGNVSVTELSLQ